MDAPQASGQQGGQNWPLCFPPGHGLEGVAAQGRARPFWGQWPHLQLKPCPPGPFSQGHRPKHQVGSVTAITPWDSEALGPSSYFQVTPQSRQGQVRLDRAPRPPQHTHPWTKPLASLLLGVSADLGLPASTLPCSRAQAETSPIPSLGQGTSPASACFCHLPCSPPTGAAGWRASLCNLRTASRPRFQGPQGPAGHLGWARGLRTSARASWGHSHQAHHGLNHSPAVCACRRAHL